MVGLLDTRQGYLYEMNIYPLGVFVKKILKVYDKKFSRGIDNRDGLVSGVL